jgi:hypothetical protein
MDRSLCERGGNERLYVYRFFSFSSSFPPCIYIYAALLSSSSSPFFFLLSIERSMRRKEKGGPWRCFSHPRRASAASPTRRDPSVVIFRCHPPTSPASSPKGEGGTCIRWEKEEESQPSSSSFSISFVFDPKKGTTTSLMVQQQQHWYKEKKRRREKRLERSYRRKMVRRDIFFHFLRGVYTHTHTRPHIKRGEKRKKRL